MILQSTPPHPTQTQGSPQELQMTIYQPQLNIMGSATTSRGQHQQQK